MNMNETNDEVSFTVRLTKAKRLKLESERYRRAKETGVPPSLKALITEAVDRLVAAGGSRA